MNSSTDLGRFLSLLAQRKLFVIVPTLGLLLIALLYTYLATPLYRAQVLIAPTEQQTDGSGLGALASQFGGLASFAGVQVGGGAKKDQALAILRSHRFTENFIVSRNLMPTLFRDKWDAQNSSWKSSLDTTDVPSIADAVRKFDEKIRRVSEDQRTGLVQLSITWEDREIAALWANEMIQDLNDFLRQIALDQSSANIEFLRAELEKNSLIQVRQAIFSLIEQQVELSMLANTRREYAFEVLDPAVAPDFDDVYWPMKVALIAFALILGAVVGVFAALIGQAIAPLRL
ncbi:MAG: Wzz/FepE/Etk N-terminal domain-containing protein [Pseudomonadota bacterium]